MKRLTHRPSAETDFNSPRREVGVEAAEGVNPRLAAGAIGGHLIRRASGFTLVEILISLGIFAIGMTAIVSLFPAAAILQRETAQDVFSEMAAQTAKSIIEANELTYEWNGTAATGDLAAYHPSVASTNTNVRSIANQYSFADRSYPTGLVDGTNIEDADLHWVPFIQDISGDPANPNWVVRLFILEADSRANYTTGNPADANPSDPITFPKVRSIGASASGDEFTINATGLGLEPGDIVMDNNGNDHIVTNVTVNAGVSTVEVLNTIAQVPNNVSTLWYAPRLGGTVSPGRRVVTVEVDVVAP